MLTEGFIVEHGGERWLVNRHNQRYRTCMLVHPERAPLEVPDDLDEREHADYPERVTVRCHPAVEWPLAVAPLKPRAGPIVKIGLNRAGRVQDLHALVDWSPADFLRPGGSIFFSPALRLRRGEVLAATHKDGSLSRITITSSFGTVAGRRAQASAPRRRIVSANAYDRLMDGSRFEDPD